MKNKIANTVQSYRMFTHDDRIAVAFSGGADSTALLDLLFKEKYKVSAIHVNHGIRGKEADRDEEFCRSFCEERNIPFFCHRIDVPSEASKTGEGLEEAARRMRYESLENTVAAEGFTRVATAHHGDDNMETLLFNLTRGSGAKGAGGIPPVRGIYVRPLIACSRNEILSYCEENGIEYVTDSTNTDTDYTRNYIRHRIVPALKEINPEAVDAFFRFSSAARQDNEYIEAVCQRIPKDEKRHKLALLEDPLLSRFIQQRAKELGVTPGYKTTEALMSAIRRGNEYIEVDMGKGIRAVCDRDTLRFFDKKEDEVPEYSILLHTGVNPIPGVGTLYLCKSRVEADKLKNIYKISIYTFLKFDKIIGDIFVTGRREGDSYRAGGMTRTLKKLFNAKKISVADRKRIPVIRDGGGIVWIPGFAPRDGLCAPGDNDILFMGYNEQVDYDS